VQKNAVLISAILKFTGKTNDKKQISYRLSVIAFTAKGKEEPLKGLLRKKVLNNEETRRVHPWVPQRHSAIAASLSWAVPSARGGKRWKRREGRKKNCI